MYDGKTLLHVAAVEGRVSVTRVLLDHKADMTAFVSIYSGCMHNTTNSGSNARHTYIMRVCIYTL